MYNISF